MNGTPLTPALQAEALNNILDPLVLHTRTIRSPFWANDLRTAVICEFAYDDGRVLKVAVNKDDGKGGENVDFTEIRETFSEEEIERNTVAIRQRLTEAQENQVLAAHKRAAELKAQALFDTKLEALEQIEAVRNSTNLTLKNKIRKATTTTEVIAYTTLLLQAELAAPTVRKGWISRFLGR